MHTPTSLAEILGKSLTLARGTSYQVLTKEARLGVDILTETGELAQKFLPQGHLLLLADHHTYPLAGEVVRRSLEEGGFTVHPFLLADGLEGRVEADDETLSKVEGRLTDLPSPVAGVIAIGAGTLNDLAKLSSFRKGLGYGIVATAASMNGYTSAIAAILSGGVKRTIPCAPPLFVVADLAILAAAPKAMTRAGVGDLSSKPVSGADWYLAHYVRGEDFDRLPIVLVERAFKEVQLHAVEIGRGTSEALGILTEALLLSGISMSCAGSSAPASGGEHLISHLWDMTSHYRGRRSGLHGAQVGVATLMTSTLYRHLMTLELPTSFPELRAGALEPFEAYAARFSSLPEALQEPVSLEASKKYPSSVSAFKSELASLSERFEGLKQQLTAFLQSPSTLRETLCAVGAPTTAAELGMPDWEVKEAWKLARDIRARYTVLDLAWQVQALERFESTCLLAAGVK